MPSWEVPACGCLFVRAFVCHNEYRGVGGCCGAVSTSGRFLCLHGNGGGAIGWCSSDTDVCCVDQPGLGGLVGGWASLTRSSPGVLESLFNKEIVWLLTGTSVGCANEVSFAGDHISSHFTSWEISKCQWTASQNWYPLDPSSYLTKIISQLFGLSLCLHFLDCASRLDTQRLLIVRYPVFHQTRVLLVFYSLPILSV